MRKHLLLILMLMALFPWSLRAQTLTINDGTVTNSYVPVYGYFADMSSYAETQFILPSGDLTAMVGSDITSLTFYANYNQNFGNASWDIYMQETNSTTLSSIASYSDNTLVYSGHLAVVSNQLVIEFGASYPYNGNNLLITFHKTQTGTCSDEDDSFYGVSATSGASAYYNYSFTPQQFLPKVTFTYEAPASCPKPMSVAATNVTANTAAISWTSDASNFVVAYGTGTDPDAMATVNATTNSAALTGLTPLTTYHVFVKADCGSGDQSAWSNMVTFTTTAVATVVDATHPFNEDFEGSVSFEFVNGSGDAWVVGSAISYGDGKSLYISGDGGTTYSYSSTYTVNFAKKLVALGNGTYHLNYYWKCKGEGSGSYVYDYLRVFLAPSSCTFTAGSMPSGLSSSAVPTGWIALDGGAALNQQETWQNHTQDFTVTEGTYYLVFMWRTDSSTSYDPPAAVDNISLTLPSCATPVNVAATDITAHGATLSWTSSASSFVVAYGTGTDPDAMLTTVNATTNSAALTGLTANTAYNVFVKAVCSATDQSPWSNMGSFRTLCNATTITSPYIDNFDSYTGVTSGATNYLPECWNYYNAGTYSSYKGYPVVYNSATSAHSGNNFLYFYSAYNSTANFYGDQYAILPEVSNVSATQLKLYARQYSTTTSYKTNLLVGVMTDPADTTTFELVETISPAGPDYEDFTVYFDQYTGTGTFIALRVNKPTSSGQIRYMFVDDIELKLIPSCFPVASISFADVERTSMTINWTKNPKANNDNFQVVISASPLDADGLAAAHPVDVNATTYTAINLERNTLYYVYVRSACDDDDYSEWVEATQRTPDLGADCSVSSLEQTIGTGTSAIQYLPWSDFYKSTYSQQIYTAAEMTAADFSAGYITKVAFQYALSASYTKTVTIYMGTTTDASFSSTSFKEVTAVTSATATTFNTAGAWYEFEFDTPFYWDGTSNIVVGAMNIGTNYPTSGTPTFYGGTTNGSMALYSRTDNGTPSTVTGTLTTNRANIKITVCPPASACPEITNLAAVTTVDEATITWTPSTGDYVGRYEIIHSDEQLNQGDLNQQYEDNNHHGDESVTAPTVTVLGRAENTQYYIYISTVCNANSHDDGMSDWVEFSYKTKADCLIPVNIQPTVNGKKDVTVTWDNGSYDSEKGIYEQESMFYWILADDDITNGGTETPDKDNGRVVAHNFDGENGDAITDDHAQITFSEAEIDVLDHDKTYYFYVRNDCGGDGAWDYITFTTPKECPAVVNLEVSNQTAHTAVLTWNRGKYGEETEWKVKWGNNEFYTTERSFLVYGLAPKTTTQVSVYAACDKNNDVFGTAATVDVNTTAEGGNFVQVGNGTSTDSYYFPISAWHHNSYTQQLYTAAEIGNSSGTVTSILFNYFWSNTTTRKITVYMGNTETANLSSGYISTDEMTEVFSAQEFTFTNTNGNWCEIGLETPFNYTGGNIVVAVYMDYNSCETQYSNTKRFYYTSSASNMARYCTSDATTPGAISFTNGVPSSSTGTAVSYRPNIKFAFVPEACPKVTTFNVNNITTETANVSWMPAGGEMTWNYVVSTSATLDEAALNAHTDASIIAYNDEDYAQRFVELNGLTPGTHYFLYVQSICDAESESVSAWSAPYEFVTIATCPAPTALLVSNITNESVQLAWTVGGTENEWEVAYYTDGAGWSTAAAPTNPYTLTGLSGNTDYQVKVKAVCSPTDDSYYTPEVNFTTECDATIITEVNPYIENFDAETFPPDCWSQTQLALTNTWSRTTSTKHGSTGGAAYIPDAYADTETALVTNAIAFDGSTDYQVIFWMYRASNSYQSKVDEAIHVYVGPDADNVTNATEIGVINEHYLNAPAEAAPGWYEYTCNVPANTAGNKYVLFVYHNQYGAGAYIDDITIRETPSCVKPSGLAVSNITNATAALAWTENGNATAWQVDYSTNGETWTTVGAGTNPFTLTGLTSNTHYYVKVRSYCTAEDQSEYSNSATFTTLCEAVTTFPYVEKFDGLTTDGQIPNCWNNDDGSTTNDTYKWSYNSSNGTGVSGKCVRFDSFINPRNNTNFLKTPELSLPSTTMYLSFQYKNPAGGDFSVYISTDGGQTYETALATGLTAALNWTQRVISLETYSGQDVVIVFGGTSNYGSGNARIYLDDVIVAPAGTFIKNGAISTADNWSGAEVPATTGYGYIAAEATVSADFTIADLNILEGGKVTVNNGATLTVTGTLTNNDEANLVINNGSQLVNASATKATVKKEITAYSTPNGTGADGWYLIAAPITDAAASMVTTGNYDFYAHDEAAYMWRNYKVAANQTAYNWLTNGYGYLYANEATQTLNFAGTLAADDQKEIPLASSTGANTGWNLLGNHTAHNVTIESDFGLLSVKVMDNDGIDYTDKLVSTDTFAPCEGFFVKATEAGQHVTINPTSTAKSQEAPQGFIQLNLVDNNTPVFTDVAYITMEGGIGSENITFSEVSPQLYVPMNGVDYSVAVVDADLTVIPVGFKATANSSYTISLNLINAHFETVILRDLKTGIDTDLKAGNYVFNGDIDDAENRFNLILAVEAPEGIGENNEPFAYQSGSDIIFTDAYGTVQVMDVLGRVMSETRIDGAARISTRGLVSGTYVLRLLGNESVRTQKIVVK